MFPRRFFIYLLLAKGVAINYAARSQIAITLIPMAEEFGWNFSTKGLLVSSFFYGYLSSQILAGYLADRIGGKFLLLLCRDLD
jgi:ACS family sodium-dependent inorganic phosphate cotransporter